MKVAIVGGSPSYVKAPFDDPEFDIWVLGNQIDRYEGKRITRIFEIHDDLSHYQPEYAQCLVDKKIPMVVGRKFPVKGPTVYPFEKVNELMGQHLTSSPAYMMGLAILEGFTHICIFGVEMAVDDAEYFYQRPVMYAWIAFAKARGIEVEIEGSLFTDEYVEGDKSGSPVLAPFTRAEFENRAVTHKKLMDEIDQQIQLLKARWQTHDGSRQTCKQLARVARAIEGGVEVKNLSDSTEIR